MTIVEAVARRADTRQALDAGHGDKAMAPGRLIALRVAAPKPRAQLSLAWRAHEAGPLTQWFVDRLQGLTTAVTAIAACPTSPVGVSWGALQTFITKGKLSYLNRWTSA